MMVRPIAMRLIALTASLVLGVLAAGGMSTGGQLVRITRLASTTNDWPLAKVSRRRWADASDDSCATSCSAIPVPLLGVSAHWPPARLPNLPTGWSLYGPVIAPASGWVLGVVARASYNKPSDW